MRKTTKLNLKKVNYHNLLEKKNRKYMILFLLGVIILGALFYFLNKREGMQEGTTFGDGDEEPIDEVEEEPIDEMEDGEEEEEEPIDEMEDEVKEEPIIEGFVDCSFYNNKKISQLMGYKFKDIQRCFLKKYKKKHNKQHKQEDEEEDEERKKDIRKGMKSVEKKIEEKMKNYPNQ